MNEFAISGPGADAGGLAAMGRDVLRLQQDADQITASANAGGVDGHAAVNGAAGFGEMLRRVDAQDHEAQTRVEAVERGESDDLVGAMLSSQQAGLSFQMLMQVRNKVMGAVDDLVKLPL